MRVDGGAVVPWENESGWRRRGSVAGGSGVVVAHVVGVVQANKRVSQKIMGIFRKMHCSIEVLIPTRE